MTQNITNDTKTPNFINIDNMGRGNCMYYAYSISLMYYLRQQSSSQSQQVLARLFGSNDLGSQHQSINQLLTKETLDDTDLTTIQNILGPKARQLYASIV